MVVGCIAECGQYPCLSFSLFSFLVGRLVVLLLVCSGSMGWFHGSLYAAYRRISSEKEQGLTSEKSDLMVLQTTFRRVLVMRGEWREFLPCE